MLVQMKKDKIKFDDSKAGLTKTRNYFRQHMAIIVVALLPNPRFDGQTKEKLTLHTKDWGFNPGTCACPFLLPCPGLWLFYQCGASKRRLFLPAYACYVQAASFFWYLICFMSNFPDQLG